MPHFIRRLFACRPVFFTALALAAASASRARAGAVEDLAAFSEIHDIDLSRLADGKAVTAPGAAMSSFPRGIAVQACYLVPLPLQKTVDVHRQFNGARHPELKVYLHRELPSKPSISDFQAIADAPRNSAVRALVESAGKSGELQMSTSEAAALAAAGAGGGTFPPTQVSAWSTLLQRRALDFVSGGLAKQPPYETGGETVRAAEEATRLLKSQAKVRDRFRELIDSAGFLSGGGKPALSWELFDVEHRAAFTLGASYSKPGRDGVQALDLQYYSSGGYYVLLTFYQFWPVQTASGPATLVWRGDLLSSATLADLHGMERTGSVTAMRKEIQKSIAFLQADARKQ